MKDSEGKRKKTYVKPKVQKHKAAALVSGSSANKVCSEYINRVDFFGFGDNYYF